MKTVTRNDVLAVLFDLHSGYTPAVGDMVYISGDNKVKKVDGAGLTTIVGEVISIKKDAGGTAEAVVVETNARRYKDMTSGAATAVGPVVLDADSKVIAYVPKTASVATALSDIALDTSNTYADAAVNTAVNAMTLASGTVTFVGHDPAAIIGILTTAAAGGDETVPVLLFR